MKITTLMTTMTLIGACTLLSACNKSEQHAKSETPETETKAGVVWILTDAPAEALAVKEAKAQAKEGDTIVIRGRIGGRKNPMSADSPVFTIMDLGLPYCGELHPENCPTPWDYCCDTPETITANSATVRIVDSDGNAVTIDPTTELSPLDEIIVVGTVGARPNSDVLTINATGVHRVSS